MCISFLFCVLMHDSYCSSLTYVYPTMLKLTLFSSLISLYWVDETLKGVFKSMRVISLSLGDQITTTLATSVLPVSSEQNS